MADTVSTVRADAPDSGDKIIEIEDLNKWYGDFHVLKDINASVNRGEVVVVIGPSGSGKSTLIRCINRLEEHQEGKIFVDKVELTDDVKKIDQIRRETGMVFQAFNLFPHLTVLENITLAPIRVRGWKRSKAEERAHYFLGKVGIPEQADKYPGQLSGGQQQRVAIARALINEPVVILADEPTGNLDTHTGNEVLELLRRGAREEGWTVIMVTHDPKAALFAERIVFLRDGRIVGETRTDDAEARARIEDFVGV